MQDVCHQAVHTSLMAWCLPWIWCMHGRTGVEYLSFGANLTETNWCFPNIRKRNGERDTGTLAASPLHKGKYPHIQCSSHSLSFHACFFSVSNVSWHFLLWSVKVGVVYLCKLSLVSKFQEEIKKHSVTSQEYGNFVHQKWVGLFFCRWIWS